jgi:hypothetical protein
MGELYFLGLPAQTQCRTGQTVLPRPHDAERTARSRNAPRGRARPQCWNRWIMRSRILGHSEGLAYKQARFATRQMFPSFFWKRRTLFAAALSRNSFA